MTKTRHITSFDSFDSFDSSTAFDLIRLVRFVRLRLVLFEGKGAALAELLSSGVGERGLAYVSFQYLFKLFDLFLGGLFADEVVDHKLNISVLGEEGVEMPAIDSVKPEVPFFYGRAEA